jgi:hypothetical protein
MAENLGHRMEICGNSGRTIRPKAAVSLGLLDIKRASIITNQDANLYLLLIFNWPCTYHKTFFS